MAKKKATGMSKRLGFTDRATIAENKEILRYNERLEREAKGLPADEPRRGGGDRGHGRPRSGAHDGRPPRNRARAPRPPALDPEQRTTMQAALDAAVGETGFEAAGGALIDRLAAHDSFEKASAAGWDVVAGGHAADRTDAEWELLRKTWLSLRLALLEAYAAIKPDLEPVLARERKQLARLDKPARSDRRRRPERGTGRGAGPRPVRKRAAPSPGDVARKLAAGVEAGVDTGADVGGTGGTGGAGGAGTSQPPVPPQESIETIPDAAPEVPPAPAIPGGNSVDEPPTGSTPDASGIDLAAAPAAEGTPEHVDPLELGTPTSQGSEATPAGEGEAPSAPPSQDPGGSDSLR